MQYPYFGEVNINNEKHFAWQHEVIYNNSPVKLMLDYRYIPSEPTFYLDKYRQCFEKIEFFDTQAKKSLQDYFVKNPKILQNKFGNLSLEDILKFLKLTIVSIHAFEDDEDEEYLLLTYDFLAIPKPISLNVCLNCEGKVLGVISLPKSADEKPIKSTIWTAIIWALVVVMGGVQYLALITHHEQIQEISSLTMLLIAMFIGLPITVITLAEWLKYSLPSSLKSIGTYVFYLLILYGFFALLDIILPKHIAFFELKMILFLHFIALSWICVFGSGSVAIILCDNALAKRTGKNINEFIRVILYGTMCFLTYKGIRYMVENTNVVAWFLNFGN